MQHLKCGGGMGMGTNIGTSASAGAGMATKYARTGMGRGVGTGIGMSAGMAGARASTRAWTWAWVYGAPIENECAMASWFTARPVATRGRLTFNGIRLPKGAPTCERVGAMAQSVPCARENHHPRSNTHAHTSRCSQQVVPPGGGATPRVLGRQLPPPPHRPSQNPPPSPPPPPPPPKGGLQPTVSWGGELASRTEESPPPRGSYTPLGTQCKASL